MKNLEMFPTAIPARRDTMNCKPVLSHPAGSIINFQSAFDHKLLCDGLTFSTGSACAYSCSFCYVEAMMRKLPFFCKMKAENPSVKFEDYVVRREGALAALRRQLTDRNGFPKFKTPDDRRVIFGSPLVDVAANMDLARETIEVCRTILTLTNWDIRLLSKSTFLPKIAEALSDWKTRMIFGVSTGTLDDRLAASIEIGTPLVSKRIESLHWLQDNGYRTYGMVCPSLPQADYSRFAEAMAKALRYDRCEHVWGEVLNARGESFTRTKAALLAGGFSREAAGFEKVCGDREAWEQYARDTFEAHAMQCTPGQFRFLQYVTKDSEPWWTARQKIGAVIL
jgi:DNA repair photolyase